MSKFSNLILELTVFKEFILNAISAIKSRKDADEVMNKIQTFKATNNATFKGVLVGALKMLLKWQLNKHMKKMNK